MTGIAGCCARAESGHAAAALPRKVMNARRLIRLPKPKDDSLPHQLELLCITAKSGALLPLWVKSRIRLFLAYVSSGQLRTLTGDATAHLG